ncbi:molecular chaperone [Atlantibacter subterranea]|uniref:Molecular chaperone n=1 Tax=Atlantibacter subterraneus TaxID=255519 RepID=A0ABU4E2K8_9ENTR|nr:molecular chaperone [Atlantibacter subterranea]MDV7023354.1 molecular chaperone [Atlantibacter subterranea]MDZ5666352.1 molecular chaperone [Atlantibacter hermannii]
MKQLLAAVMASFFLFCATAKAGIVMGGTRVIYQEGKREASLSVTNMDTNVPYLVQSWVENPATDDQRPVPFVVTPPLFRLEPEQENVLRISFTGGALPADKESVFWLCVKNISPTQKDDINKLQINVKSKFKLFWRPKGLGESKDAWQKLTFTRNGNQLVAHNPTPFYISFYSLAVGGKEIPEPGMIAPLASKTWPVSNTGQVTWRAINDFGGITDAAQQ